MFKIIKQSLAKSTLLSIGIRLSLVTTIVALISYQHIIHSLKLQTSDELKKYISERAQKESSIFKLAEDNHQIIKKAFLESWQQRKHNDPDIRFNKLFQAEPDGTYRIKHPSFTGEGYDIKDSNYFLVTKWLSGFVSQHAPIESVDFRNRLLLAYDLTNRYGPGWSNRFANTYIMLPEGVNLVYWPKLNWAANANASLDLSREEWFYIADKQHDKTRISVWTGLYYDEVANQWMVSCITPVDDKKGRYLMSVGHDILLNKVFERVINDHIAGAYNFIIRADGRLIAHPQHLKELEHSKGLLNVNDMPNSDAFSQFNQITNDVTNSSAPPSISYDSQSDALIAYAKISGPEWYFVTVYPMSLLSTPARQLALFIFALGLISLIVELIMLYRVLFRKVLKPMEKFEAASESVSQKNYQILPILGYIEQTRKDEIGRLAGSFITMASRLSEYTTEMEKKVSERTLQLEEARNVAELQARTDPLTELPNRRAFFEISSYKLQEAKRYGNNLTMIMLDIDKFKTINDSYGHDVGDIVLKTLALQLQKSLRTSDLCARIGGEEFVILLSNSSLEESCLVAEKLRLDIENMVIVNNEQSFKFTSSFGLAYLSSKHETIEELLKEADIALYNAKQKGRNCVVVYKE